MRIVYRVENDSNEGMYTGKSNLNQCLEYQSLRTYPNEKIHPLPSFKMLEKSYKGWLFGFESKESIVKWLCDLDWIGWLDDCGYQVSAYEVREDNVYNEDHRQLVFKIDEFQIIERFSLINLVV